LGWREILMIAVVIAVLFYSRSFRVLGVKKSLGIDPITPKDEVRVGKTWLSEIANKQQITPEKDPRVTEIMEVFHRVAEFRFKHYPVFRLHSSEINAMALPGAHLVITSGLMELPDLSEAELAGILAHEIGHVELGHTRNAVIQKNRTEALKSLLSVVTRGPAKSVVMLEQLANLGISRESELEADDFALQLLSRAGYSPMGLITFLERAQQREGLPEWLTFFSTHPATQERVQRLNQKLSL
ncbi:MAG: M48 family metallopeptidase, partial [Acidobacteriota bacterium]